MGRNPPVSPLYKRGETGGFRRYLFTAHQKRAISQPAWFLRDVILKRGAMKNLSAPMRFFASLRMTLSKNQVA
jgi:hypothetical protein